MLALAALTAAVAAPVDIPAGVHAPFYPSSEEARSIPVAAFRLDATQVTNADFLDFVLESPRWRRDQIPSLLADARYLADWQAPSTLGPEVDPDAPVTGVSWHAARAYCQHEGGRLPTITEWEYAADATATSPHGNRADPETLQRILAWYGRGGGEPLEPVGQGPANLYGVYGLHAVVWEWTEDFNSTLITSDPRESEDGDVLLFCGAGALAAADPRDYATFMRSAFRSSLRADYTTSSLGFRCAYSP